jgi:hypothetical protein
MCNTTNSGSHLHASTNDKKKANLIFHGWYLILSAGDDSGSGSSKHPRSPENPSRSLSREIEVEGGQLGLAASQADCWLLLKVDLILRWLLHAAEWEIDFRNRWIIESEQRYHRGCALTWVANRWILGDDERLLGELARIWMSPEHRAMQGEMGTTRDSKSIWKQWSG